MRGFAILSAVLLALILVVPVGAQGSARSFSIGNQPFAESDIVDARAQPEVDGGISILLTFEDPAAAKLARLVKDSAGKPVPVTLDGKLLAQPIFQALPADGQLVIASGAASVPDAEKLARRIAGKDPLPDSLDE